jgi:RHS repeat-associated protein
MRFALPFPVIHTPWLVSCVLVLGLVGCGHQRGDSSSPLSDSGTVDTAPSPEFDDGGVDASLAPPLDRTVASDFASGFGFIYEGLNATQTGVQPGAIDKQRLSIVRGRVIDNASQPVADVRISVADELALGSTKSKSDGTFDLAVNGGGAVRVALSAAGYLPSERTLKPLANAFERAPDVVLSKLDAKVSEVTLGAGQPQQVVVGSAIVDRSGARTGTLVFGAGTTATMIMSDGREAQLTSAHVRVTEYTAGDLGPKAMPATLPPQSGYTYAVELTVDEAESAGARDVKFSKPVPYYVENFLNFPVGEPVPSGYLDRARGVWIPSESGRVIKVLAVAGSAVELDTDGDNKADVADALSKLGIEADELSVLAARYAPGTTLWRVPLPHFSAWDFNWCFFGRLFDAVADLFDNRPLTDSCTASGSFIECENQILGESIAVSGAPFGLHYRSDRVPGRRDAFHFEVQLTGETAPPNAKRVRFELDVLGQHVTHVAEAKPGQRYTFDWDGRDAYGRVWQGPARVQYRVGYVYDGWYGHTPVFGAYGETDRTRWQTAPDNQSPPAGVTAEDDLARLETTMWLPWQATTLGTFDASALGLGGFTLGVHHAYDPSSHTLYLGTGDRRQATPDTRSVRALLGAVGAQHDESGQARRTSISMPHGLAVAPNGTVYVSLEAQHKVVRVGKDGVVQTVAGTGMAGATGDGGPATLATLASPLGLALAADGTLYIAERTHAVVRRVLPNGIIDTFAGALPAPPAPAPMPGTPPPVAATPAGDDGSPKPARMAVFAEPHALALGLDGSLLIADSERNHVRRVRPDGVIEVVLGSAGGSAGSSGDGGPGTKALLRNPLSVAVGPDGSVYVAEYDGHRIRRLTPDGTVMTVAGDGTPGRHGDEGPATAARLSNPHTVDVGPDGTLYITDEGNAVLRSVTPDGIMHTIAGGGTTQPDDYTPALDAEFALPRITVVEPNGNLVIADYSGDMVHRVLPFLPSASPGGSVIASEDGLSWDEFDAGGRHLKTVNALSKQTLLSFQYDAAGRLTSITDPANRVFTIEREASGRAARLVSPDGLATSLAYDTVGWLASVENPAREALKVALSETGLLLSETDPQGRVHSFSYDPTGRLTKDTEASGSFQTLERSANQATVMKTDALGHTITYAREQTAGAQKLTVTGPDGLKSVRTKSRTTTTTRGADGSLTTIALGADPRFGMQAAYARSLQVKLPSGLLSEVVRTRQVKLRDAEDPSSLQTLRETTTLEGGGSVDSVFDAEANTSTITSFGDTQVVSYDAQGRVAQVAAPNMLPIMYAYDAASRLAELTQGARTTRYAHDANGFLSGVTDAAGVAHTFERDAVGRTLSSRTGQATLSSFAFAPGGDLTTLSTPTKAAHTFRYDMGGRVSSYVAPSAKPGEVSTTAYGYAADDVLESVTMPSGAPVQRVREPSGRLSSVMRPDGAVTFKYDDKTGALVAAALGADSLSFTWDGSLPLSATSSGTVSSTVSAKYDTAFRLSADTVQGVAAARSYDGNGRLTMVLDEQLAYRDAKRLSSRTIESLTEQLEYSSEYGELATHDVKVAGKAALKTRFTRDALGRISSQTESVLGAVERIMVYAYDALGRLTEVRDASGTHAHHYDDNGNRLDDGATYDAQDRLLQRAGVRYNYTPDGQLERRTDASGERTYSYDATGQLTRVVAGGKTITYVIDALGRRIGKRVDGQLVQGFVYDLEGRLAAVLDGAGLLVSRFVYASRGHVPDLMVQGTTTLVLVSDTRGSPRLVVDPTTGQVLQQLDYDVWGNVLRDTAPGLQPFGLAGGLWDGDTRLVRFGARDYDAEIGRWTGKDPILFGGGQANLYAYVGSDPVNRIDPTGEVWWILGGAAAGAAVNLGLQLHGSGGDWRSVDWSGVAAGSVVGAVGGAWGEFALGSAFSATSTSGTLVAVTHYGPATPWVMLGGNTFRNWLMSGSPELGYKMASGITEYVDKAQLAWPSGIEFFKGIFGQRICKP